MTISMLKKRQLLQGKYQEIFHKHGGEKIQLVESLNSGDDWVETIKKIALQ